MKDRQEKKIMNAKITDKKRNTKPDATTNPKQPKNKIHSSVSPSSSGESDSEVAYGKGSNSEWEESEECEQYQELESIEMRNIKKGQFVVVQFECGERKMTTKKYLCIIDEVDAQDQEVKITAMIPPPLLIPLISYFMLWIVIQVISLLIKSLVLFLSLFLVVKGELIYYKFEQRIPL